MFITLDGVSGAGKTTQAQLLREQLSLQFTCFEPMMYALENIPIIVKAGSRHTSLLAGMMATHTIPYENCIVELFWAHFEYAYELSAKDRDALLSFFQTGLTLGGRRTPDASIYLSVPYDVHINRIMKRDLQQNVAAKPDKQILDEYEKRQAFWHTIAERVSYFHVVDGTLPISEVNELLTSFVVLP